MKVWYAAGTALGDAVPDAWGNQNHEHTTKNTTVASSVASSAKLPAETGWSVPGYGALSCFEDPEARDGSSGSAGSSASRFVVAPGPARRPAAWFPCVDDARSLVLFSVRARVPADCVAVAPGVPVDLPEDADDEDDASPTRAFAFDSGGIPTQAHQMCLAVGTFATKRKARETASREEEGAAQRTDGDGDGDGDEIDPETDPSAAKKSSSSSSGASYAVHAPRGREWSIALDDAFGALGSILGSMESYLGRASPWPGGVAFVFVPPDASPSSRCGGVDALSPFGGALLAAGIVICSTDRLAHPASHADVVSARDAMGEFAARLAFGGFLEPRDASDAWLAEGLRATSRGSARRST